MERSYFHSSSGTLSYLRREGNIPTVFIHGFTASAYIWRSMTKYLDRNLDLTYVDLFGHGKSEMPSFGTVAPTPRSMIGMLASSIGELIESLGFSSYFVVGSSLGGWVALELAARFRKPEKAVLIDSAGLMSLKDSKFAEGLYGLVSEYSKRKGKAGRQLLQMVQNTGSEGLTMERKLLDSVDFSTCVIWGSEDHILDPDYGRKLSGMLPRSEFHLIPGADHVPFRTHPKEVAEKINSFLVA